MLLGWRNGVTPPAWVQRRMMLPGMSLNSRNFAVGCQSGPSVNMNPLPRATSSAAPPTTERKRGSRTSAAMSGRARAEDLYRLVVDEPVFVRDLLPHDPNLGARQQGRVRMNCLTDAPRYFVLLRLR